MKAGVKSILFLLMCANLPIVLLGQQHQEPDLIELTGVLLSSDSLKPIPDAEVYSKQNVIGTFTDSKGNFSIAVVLGDSLLFSSLGYGDMEVLVDDSLLSKKPPIRFFMKLDTIQMHEVVIHAYWDYRTFKQKIIDMKMQTHPFDITDELKRNPLLYRKPSTGISVEGPVQLLYNLFNSQAVLERRLEETEELITRI